MELRISEIFKSCQGEGPNTGLPTVFVRTAGCNLALAGIPCSFCDTKYAQKSTGRQMTIHQIVERISELSVGCTRVCLTGGEPLYQMEELHTLIDVLKFREYYVEIFTNGTLRPPSWFSMVDVWIVDIKCPSSGVTSLSLKEWIMKVREQDIMKFVVGDKDDLSFVEDILVSYKVGGRIVLSPCITTEVDKAWGQVVWDFCVRHNCQFGLQVHKVIFGNKKGV